MVPIVEIDETQADKRKGKKRLWREAKICLAHPQGSKTLAFGGTLQGDVDVAGQCLFDCAIRAGFGTDTPIHGVGDGAPWIADQIEKKFGAQGSYLVDFFHVCDYLSAAGKAIHHDEQAQKTWMDEQKNQLKTRQANAVALPASKMKLALSAKSALIQSGLVKQADGDFLNIEDRIEVPDNLCRILLESHADVDSLLQSFFSEATPAKLKPEDFSHLAKDFELLSSYFQKVQHKKVAGVNILLYGDPGVGKSEFARLIAKNVAQPLYEVACADDDGDAINGQARFASFMLSQKMLASAAGCIVLFDEIEDVFPSSTSGLLALFAGDEGESATAPGKAWINRILETNPVPAIWITNSISQIDPAYLRRFDYALEVPKPPKDVRRRIVSVVTQFDGNWGDYGQDE